MKALPVGVKKQAAAASCGLEGVSFLYLSQEIQHSSKPVVSIQAFHDIKAAGFLVAVDPAEVAGFILPVEGGVRLLKSA